MASLKIKYAAIIISSLIAGGLISVTAWQYVNSSQKTVQTEQKAPERKVLFWYDPMKPDVKFDKPGKSRFMDMDLVPKYADENDDKNGDSCHEVEWIISGNGRMVGLDVSQWLKSN